MYCVCCGICGCTVCTVGLWLYCVCCRIVVVLRMYMQYVALFLARVTLSSANFYAHARVCVL